MILDPFLLLSMLKTVVVLNIFFFQNSKEQYLFEIDIVNVLTAFLINLLDLAEY